MISLTRRQLRAMGIELPGRKRKPGTHPRAPGNHPTGRSEPGLIRFTVYAKTRGPNGGLAWYQRLDEKAAGEAAYIETMAGGLNHAAHVTMTRYSTQEMDDDNLGNALKKIQDGIWRAAGVDDKLSNGWVWIRRQARCLPGEERVEVEIRTGEKA